MKPNSQYCAEHNSRYVGLAAQAHELAAELAHEPVHELAIVGADHASNAPHAHAADALASDAGALEVGHGHGHRVFSERGLMARRNLSNLQTEQQAPTDLIIPDSPPFVERTSNSPFPVALASGRSDEPHLSVSRWPR